MQQEESLLEQTAHAIGLKSSYNMSYLIESQTFSRWWLLVILLPMSIPLIVIVSGHSQDSEAVSALIISFIVCILLAVLFLFSRLETRVTSDGIFYRYHPFHRREHHIPAEDISKIWVRKYDPIGEYGGWGIRYGISKGKFNRAYNTRGNMGIQIVLTNGKRVLIGTQLPDAVRDAIASAFPRQSVVE
jgi:hypothetical protein